MPNLGSRISYAEHNCKLRRVQIQVNGVADLFRDHLAMEGLESFLHVWLESKQLPDPVDHGGRQDGALDDLRPQPVRDDPGIGARDVDDDLLKPDRRGSALQRHVDQSAKTVLDEQPAPLCAHPSAEHPKTACDPRIEGLGRVL